MNKKLGAVYYDHQTEHPFLGQRIATDTGTSDATVSAIEREARATLAEALRQADELIVLHRERFEQLTQALLDHETVEKEELAAILGPPLNDEGGTTTLAAAVGLP
jgi:cell division protease FtsH